MEEKKQIRDLTWPEILKGYLLLRVVAPIIFLILYFFIMEWTGWKGDIVVGIGVVTVLGTFLGFLNFLYVEYMKVFKFKQKVD